LQPYFERVRMKFTLPKLGLGSPLGFPKTSEFDCRGQNTLHWNFFCIIEKLAKCKCQKWARMDHLDIYNTSYGKKKGRESNWQFHSRLLKVGKIDLTPVRVGGVQNTIRKLSRRATSLFQISSQSEVWAKSYDLQSLGNPNWDSFETSL